MRIISTLIIGITITRWCQPLIIEELQPKVIPDLSHQANNQPGGYTALDLSKPDQYEHLQHIVNYAIDIKQGQESAASKNYVYHKLIKIKNGLEQIVQQAKNYDVVFYVGERLCSRATLPRATNDSRHHNNSGELSGSDRKDNKTSAGSPPGRKPLFIPCFIKYDGQHGKCYFRINQQLKTNGIDVKNATCEKASSRDVYLDN